MTVLAQIGTRLDLSRRLRQWLMTRVRQRRGPVALPFELEYRHIYVMPTTFGAAFALMLVFMALGGLNFNNNMALLMVFVLGIIAQLTTLLAYRNLVGLKIEAISAKPVFCGEPAHYNVYVANPEERPRFAIQADLNTSRDCRDISGNTTVRLEIRQPADQRGWLAMEPFKLENRYPLGLFRAWSWFFPTARCLVYPAPATNPPPLPVTGEGRSGTAIKGEGDQIHGLREYRSGDSLRRVAWRTSARHDALYTREMETPRQQACELAWNRLSGMDAEQRLSVLTSWVLQAERRQLTFSLDIPGTRLPPAEGAEQRARCLEALALFGS
jgi:uncharacterized protein (DUF58 family)